MNKKFISFALSLLLVLNTLTFIPAFAAEESLIAEDVITYPDSTVVLYENNFDKGEVGTDITELTYKKGYSSNSNTNYLSATYSFGVGDNETNVAKFYDKGYTTDGTVRLTDRGEADTAAVQDKDRGYDTLGTAVLFSGREQVTTTFRYYFAEAAKNAKGQTAGYFCVMYPKDKGNISSSSPEIAIYPTNITLCKDKAAAKKTISGLSTKTWTDVSFTAKYDAGNNVVTIIVKAGDKEPVTTSYERYDGPAGLSFYFPADVGGRVYIDDLKVTSVDEPSENFKAAVDEFTFNDAVSGETSNIQTAVYEEWPAGFMTSFTRQGETFGVEWESSNPDIISHDGKVVNRRSYPQKVKLTAKLSQSAAKYAHRTFEVIVAPFDNATNADILKDYSSSAIKASLFSDEVTDDSNRITKDLKPLPTIDDMTGIEILWSSSHPEIIDPLTGKVTRPASTGEDTVVTLTAALTKDGSDPVCKTIEYTVVKRTDPAASIDEVIENLVLTEEDYSKVTKNINLPTEYGDVEISWDVTGHSQIAQNGVVTRGDDEVTADIVATFTLEGITKTKTYTITVYPTLEKMIEKDVALVVAKRDNWNALTGNITVDLIGEKYNTVMTWNSASDYVRVGENGQIIIKRPPNSHENNLSTNLIVTGRLGNVEKDITVPITVLKQASDSETAQEAANEITFDSIRGTGNTQDAVVKNLSLITGFVNDKSLIVEWTSSNENVVKTNGEVIRPLLGQGDEVVTLTVKVKKNLSYSQPVNITFTVKAISSIDEVLEAAKNNLTFSKLSTEEIDSVTKNLTLPAEGKYGSTIEWSCDSKYLTISGNEGIVTRPEWGELENTATLNAAISYEFNGQSKTVNKEFSITILESETCEEGEVLYSENFNTWTDSYKFSNTTKKGIWAIPDASTSGLITGVCSNPTNVDDTSLYVQKSGSGTATSFVSYTNSKTAEATSVGVSTKFYVKDDFEGKATICVFSTGTFDDFNPRVVIDGSTNKIEVVTATESGENITITTLELEKGTFEKGKWNELRFDMNTRNKRFHVYLNGDCITENGYVRVKGQGTSFSTVIGIPYVDKSAITVYGIRGVKFSTDADTVYFDDLLMNSYSVHTVEQKRAADAWVEHIYMVTDPSNVKTGFELADPHGFPGMTVTVSTSHSSILNLSAYKTVRVYFDLDKKTAVTLTANFDNGKSVYKRSVVFYVYPQEKDVVDTTISDTDAVAADLSKVVSYIKNNFNLTNLKTSIDFANIQFVNGSTMTFVSSNENIISNSGQITMANSAKTVTVTITAKKGVATKSEVLTVVVGAKSQTGGAIIGGGGTGGGGGGLQGGGGGGGTTGSKPVSGENSTPQTGIDIDKPSDGDNENSESSENSENTDSSSAFTDVKKDHWAYDQINFLVEKKIINGVGDGRIEPERTINREEFVKMLVVALELDLKDAKSDFTDVDANEWYAPYVATIKEKGLINGFEDGSFGIGQNISRQDLAVLIYRSSDLAKEDVKDVFADDSEIADYAKDAVYTLRDLGIINGKGEGKFDPAASATRAETATMLYKAIKAGLFE